MEIKILGFQNPQPRIKGVSATAARGLPPFPEREIVRPGPRRQGSGSLRALDGSGLGLGTRCLVRERGNCNGENPPGRELHKEAVLQESDLLS